MIKVEVLIDNFKDLENFDKPIKVIRNEKEITIHRRLLFKGDVYEITKERYNLLSKDGIVCKYKDNIKTDIGE